MIDRERKRERERERIDDQIKIYSHLRKTSVLVENESRNVRK